EDAGALKEAASNALWENKNVTLQCSAVNQYNQWTQIQLRTLDIWPCMMNVINQIVLWAKQCLQQVDVDMKEKIYQNGILLSGGLANCFGLRQTLEEELNQKVICSEHPEMDLMEALKGWR
ncbi:rod shape-determining protein, partial [Faecalicoccus pleomorphus]|uniref:rod shape-determining protein n=1 Tax=Faecalicoccus pleomorphus TaxID=1323 RepID=UPI0026EFDBDD